MTGATGFLGGALVRRLVGEGVTVTATGRDEARGRALEALGVTFVPADLTDGELVRALCRDRDVVFHCGALSSPWGRASHFHAANVLGTNNVVAGCLASGARLVHVSSPSVYGGLGDRRDIREDAEWQEITTHYAHTKRLAETNVRRALPQATIVRPRAIFGPGDNAILPRVVRALRAGRLPIVGDGRTLVDLTFVDDAAEALVLCATRDAAIGRTYNVTGGDVRELWPLLFALCDRLGLAKPKRRLSKRAAWNLGHTLERVAAATGGWEPPLTRYTVTVLSTSLTLDISAVRGELGYRPTVSVDEGLERYAQALEEG
ncbi:NAD-dependent epimerase/dehydratase family protein [Deinococcus yavapaiensis]|uniref:Nucleoside-diphosphate-sugar epimerase n=1 Tax=Deinococcus yavapaiensis KR-236 TaxID=694435 RepID=A0A318SHE6_9DEIO|nr:NAD-dependent epimerase/dehydratase family protein [Deinococcus yavapaiensis]PYE56555.1 nucleoside-diphosphate-sugar epimerase [Deinococcus yavapaiensis KR-236]